MLFRSETSQLSSILTGWKGLPHGSKGGQVPRPYSSGESDPLSNKVTLEDTERATDHARTWGLPMTSKLTFSSRTAPTKPLIIKEESFRQRESFHQRGKPCMSCLMPQSSSSLAQKPVRHSVAGLRVTGCPYIDLRMHRPCCPP